MNQNAGSRTLFFTAAALLGLLALTIGAAHVDLGPFNLIVALAISIAKAALVAFFFMEVRRRGRLVWLALGAGLFWLAIMFALSLSDFMTRGWKMRKSAAALVPASYLSPMKALGWERLPTGRWRCEIKFDGYRAIAVLNGGAVELWSRNHKSLASGYPEVVAALAKVKCRNAVLDGEIVALDSAGRSRFQLLQGRDLSGERPPLVYYVFDLMYLDGEGTTALPLEERQKRLHSLLRRSKAPLQLSPWFEVEPAELMRTVRREGLEGIVAKRPGSLYESDRRSGAWLKCKVLGEQEFVIGGFTLPQRSRQFFGAILIGYYRRGKLLYAGKVGTGFDRRLLESLHGEFLRRRRADCPFSDLPREKKPRFGAGMTRGEMRKVSWLRPDLVAQIRFAEWTNEGVLRQPVFLGLRRDKAARDVRREASSVKSR